MSICQNETGLSQFRNVDVDANESINGMRNDYELFRLSNNKYIIAHWVSES